MNWKRFLQATTWQFKQPSTCAFNHDLLGHGIKKNTGWSSEYPHNGLEEIPPNQFE